MKMFTNGIMIWIMLFVQAYGQSDSLHCNPALNQIQIIGSHNSYKVAMQEELWEVLFQKDSSLAYSLQYEHPSVTQQLNIGLRSLEIDVFHDPEGGKYNHPYGQEILKSLNKTTDSFDPQNELTKPGLKIFHIQDIDFRSHNLLFKDCLEELKLWSDQNKGHIPVIITINAKDEAINEPNITVPLPFTKNALDSIDLEIKSILHETKLITPDLIKGEYATLEGAILEKGWPKIDDLRGRFMFVLDETGEKLKNYLNPDGSLTGKVMFVDAEEGNSSAAVRIVNDPVNEGKYIKELVRKGYLVRTRADSETEEARSENYVRFNKAVESGAQIISTDYYIPSRLFESYYRVIFNNGNYVKPDCLIESK